MNKHDLVGRKVLHFSNERGVIKSITERERHQGDIMVVRFSGGEEGKYLYPQSFESTLEIKDKAFSEVIEKDLAEYRQALAEKQKQKEPKRTGPKTDPPRNNPKKNAAFKCTYNDGGIDRNGIGFTDVCSDEQIWRNIRAGRKWCSNADCSCKRYYDGEISRRELDRGWGPCYESRMLTDWIAEAGVKYSGKSEETAIKIRNAFKDSLAVLTTRLPGAPEKERIIFGLFIVGDFYEGDDDVPGYLEAHPEFRLVFSAEEGSKL